MAHGSGATLVEVAVRRVDSNTQRDEILQRTTEALDREDLALALIEGGSVARGASDQWSDLDLVAFAGERGSEAVFAAVEAVLGEHWGIRLAYSVPEPTWHGHRQRFYQLSGVSRFLMIDLVVVDDPSRYDFTERERHGEPSVLFDRAGLVRVTEFPPEEGESLRETARRDLHTSFEMFQPLVEKEIHRGRVLDAIGFYHALTLRPLVRLARLIHNPARHDYGFRYLEDDLPGELHRRLESLALVGDLDDLRRRHREACELFAELWEAFARI